MTYHFIDICLVNNECDQFGQHKIRNGDKDSQDRGTDENNPGGVDQLLPRRPGYFLELYDDLGNKILNFSNHDPLRLTGQAGVEPATFGFGDRRSANWSYWPISFLFLH